MGTRTREFDFDLTYYLSGPMAGYPDHNFPMFTACALVLRNSGVKLVCPHELTLPTEPDPAKEGLDYLANDFAVMSAECQGLILIPGWPQSYGAGGELQIALKLKWPVYFFSPTTASVIDMNRYPDE